MTTPASFCTLCRALLDRGQECGCAAGQRIPLDADGAADRVEQAVLVTPNVDTQDLTSRIVVGSVAVLSPIALTFFGFYVGIRVLSEEFAEAWPLFLGLPYALLALGWVGFMTWSAMEERKPYYSAADHLAPRKAEHEGRLDTGALVASEIQQRGAKHRVVVRDARIEEALVLKRPGERITVPAGRVDIYLPESRFRPGGSTLTDEWRLLPDAVFQGGIVKTGGLRRGDRIGLYDGELVPEGHDETGFREAAEARLRWVPRGGRTKLFVVVHG